MIKKLFGLFSVLLFIFVLVACSGGNDNNKSDENDIKVMQINDLIGKLPEVITIDDEEKVTQIIRLYDSLPNKYRDQINNYDKVLNAKQYIDSIKFEETNKVNALKVINLIKELPSVENIKLSDNQKVQEILNEYNSLNEEAKTLVSNYNTLEQIVNKINELKNELSEKVKNVMDAINVLNSKNLTLNDKQEVVNVRKMYDALLLEEKELVLNFDLLVKAENKIKELEQVEEYKSLALVVTNLISNLPQESNLTLDDKADVVNVRNAYNNLDDNAKEYVTGLSRLVSLETRIATLEKASSDAKVFDDLVNTLPNVDDVSIDDKENILNARNYYNNLSILAKTYTTMNAKLVSLEEKIILIEKALADAKAFDDLVNALPSVENIDLNRKDDVVNARNTYNNLTDLAKTYVTMLTKLVALEEQIILIENTEVTNILDCVSDVVTSNTVDTLILENKVATFTWSSSNKNLYVINGDTAYVNMAYQKHQTQKVTVTVTIKYKAGGSEVKSKEIIVDPVLFDDMPSTPVATYYQSGATSSYKSYSDRYKTEKTLFSTKAKEVLDIVYYAFAIPSSDGTITISNMSYFNEVIKIREYGVRVVLSINGVGTDTYTAFNTITKDANLINTFVQNTMNLVDANYLDGVDIDWESVNSSNIVNATQMNNLVKAFRTEMTNRQATNGSNYLLTAAIPGTSWGAASSRFDLRTLNNYLDYVNMMSYDSNRTDKTTHHAPLYKSSNDGGYGFGVDYATTLFANNGLSKSKIIVGAAGYGKAFKITGTVSSTSKYPGLGVSGTLGQVSGITGSYASGTLFGNAVETLLKNSNYVKYNEYNSSNQLVASYLYSETDKIFVTYDSSEVIEAKYNYASKVNGMGIMCWAYTEDTSDTYINTIYDVIN